ncbi:MAG TPA: hypothetical protein VM263_02875, partial [Acidimicrobiales bacterium]|nr:hypothetical protein [Acidimicrobiales bacterium]
AEAERIARDAFAGMGVALDGFAVEDGWTTWEARVQPRVEGMEVVGLDWWLGVGPGGRIHHAGGFLASVEKIGDYPLAGADVGLRRLTEGFGGGDRALPAPHAPAGTGTDDGAGASEAGSGPAATIAPTDAELRDAERRDAERRDAVLRDRQAAAQSGQAGGAVPPGAEPAVGLPSPVVDCADPTVSCAAPEPAPIVDCADPSVLCAAPEPAPAVDCADPSVLCAPTEPAPVPVPEPAPAPVPEPVVVDVTGARVVLAHLDGVLVPSYLFELAGGGTSPPVPAVTDEWLDRQGLGRPEGG